MTFISYAQNFEDVMLWRALRQVTPGFYIDVGAAHPDLDSVTRAFFERGWRGINIEPGAEDAARIAAARPGDVTLQLAAGREDGEAAFFTVPGTGLSTLDASVADSYRDGNWNLRSGRIAVRTLAGICRAHVRGAIHFLKIDVEGAEADVLAGADLVAYRPWIILVEATAPLSAEQTHAAWEPGLLEQGYRFVWFDGLNRFYLAEERAEDLSVHFRVPPNVFDDFICAADTVWAQRVAAAEARGTTLQDMLATAGRQAAETATRSADRADLAGREIARLQQARAEERHAAAAREAALRAEVNHLFHERHAALHEVQRTHLRLQAALIEADERSAALGLANDSLARSGSALRASEAWLEAVRQSTSWRLTAPLRVALRRAGRGTVTPAAIATSPALSPGPGPASPPAPASAPAPAPAPAPAGGASPVVAPPPTPSGPQDIAAPPAPALPAGFLDVVVPHAAITPPAGPPRRSVHQFHSGSAVADAITNAMLLTRTLLREFGYTSEIFVTHRDPALAHELREIDELPEHDDYVLILRHSIGHDAFDRIAALGAPKILLYHNITPPDLLTRHPVLAAYAALGRIQLAALRRHVHAALADSEYNAIELRQLGFDAVRSCALLFDVRAMRARADALPSRRGGVFTILFVGRICQSKAQAELVAAYAAFRALHGAPARLVLVGRHDGDADPYLQAVRRSIAATAYPSEILLTGLVDDDARDGWYAQADLYVSLSRHEGFGVPLIEAMAHGVPVLARPSGAVPYTLGDPACLLDQDAGPAEIGALLAEWATDAPRRAARAATQRASLDRFALPGQGTILLQALLRAGAAMPEGPGAREALTANLRFAVAGHVNTSYSLAAVNRGLALELEAARPSRVRLIPVEGAVTSDLSEVPAEQRDAIAVLVQRPAPLSAPELIISQHYPVFVPPRAEGQIRLALLFWEESLLPAETIATLQAGFHGVVAPTRFVAAALQDSGLRLPVRVIDHAPRLDAYRAVSHGRQRRGVTTFLHVSSCFPRKGADLLLRGWAEAGFTASDPVRLLIKSFPNPHNTIGAELDALRDAHPGLAPVTLIDDDLDQAALADLYAQSDVMVLPSRGEGYNLPAAEALAAGLRLIVTGAGGHMDFCAPGDPRIRLLRYRHALSASHVAAAHSVWLEPDLDDLVAALREAALQDPADAQAAASPTHDVADAMTRFGLDLLLQRPHSPVRVAWVSSWNQKCGIAEYSSLMLQAMQDDPDLAITVLCDHRTAAYAPLPGGLSHIPCWPLGDGAAESLLRTISRTDPHAVVIQHQPGLIPWHDLPALLHGCAAQRRVVSVTLHNTRDLLELPPDARASVLAALAGADRVIVHTLSDLDRLTGLAVRNATLFPHGARTPRPFVPARPLAVSDAPVIGCHGFLLPGKGIDILAAAALLLREQWPGLQLRLVNAAYGGAESEAEIARTRAIAEPLGQAAQFHTGFLSQEQSISLLAGCDVVALPHRPSREAFSGAMCTALAASVPVAVSDIRLFDEAGDAVLRIDADGADTLARGLDRLLRDLALRRRLQEQAGAWMAARAWPPLASRLSGLLVGLVRSKQPWSGPVWPEKAGSAPGR